MREKLKARSVRFKGRLNLTKKIFNYYYTQRSVFAFVSDFWFCKMYLKTENG